jgi:hypothetical protein
VAWPTRFGFFRSFLLAILNRVTLCATITFSLLLLLITVAPTAITAREITIIAFTLAITAAFTRLITLFIALGSRFVLASLVVSDHTKIVIGELQVIFCLNPVTIMLGILGKLLVLVEQLRRVPARTAVDSVERVARALITITAATAAIISITIQGDFFLFRDPAQFQKPCARVI